MTLAVYVSSRVIEGKQRRESETDVNHASAHGLHPTERVDRIRLFTTSS